jgi:chromosome undetermined scaffold_110, whole genome shotgun sequence
LSNQTKGATEKAVIAAILRKDGIKPWGFRVASIDNGIVKDATYDTFIKVYKTGKLNILNAKVVQGYERDFRGNPIIRDSKKVEIEEVVGVGMSLDRLPKINIRLKPTDYMYVFENKFAVVYAVKLLGGKYKLVDYGGKVLALGDDDFKYYKSNLVNLDPLIDEEANLSKIMNVPLDKRANSSFNPSVSGVKMNEVSDALRAKTEREIKEREEKEKSKRTMMGLFDLSEDNCTETDYGLVYSMPDGGIVLDFQGNDDLNNYKKNSDIGAGYKIANALMHLRNLNYFYFSIIQELNRVLVPAESLEIGTMAVSPTTLFVNVGFVDSKSIPELTFVLMHEAMHILFRHNYYGIGKNQDIHNVATDLIINKTITDEYGCLPGNKSSISVSVNNTRAEIKYPDDGLWLEAIDTKVDTSESVYHELISCIEKSKQGQSQGQIQQKGNKGQNQGQGNQGNSQGNQSQGQGNQRQGQGNQGNAQGNQGQGSQSQGQGNQSQGQGQGQCSQGQGNQSQGQGSQGNAQGNAQGSQGNAQGNPGQGSQGQGNSNEPYEITFRGTKLTVNPRNRDIVLSVDDCKNGKEAIGDVLNKIANKAIAACKIAGRELSPNIEAVLQIETKRRLKPRWQKILKDFLSKLGDPYYTFAAVNKKYVHRGLTVPGPKVSEENLKKLKNIVLAIDTSGSMFSDENLSNIVSLAVSIVKKYNADGEIIYWDTSVSSAGTFKDRRSLVRTSVKGGGGTDINCLFEYLDKKYPRKYNKPSLILVMTDGYFGTIKEDYVKRYKNVIWAITEEDYNAFKKPENGKLAVIENKSN